MSDESTANTLAELTSDKLARMGFWSKRQSAPIKFGTPPEVVEKPQEGSEIHRPESTKGIATAGDTRTH